MIMGGDWGCYSLLPRDGCAKGGDVDCPNLRLDKNFLWDRLNVYNPTEFDNKCMF